MTMRILKWEYEFYGGDPVFGVGGGLVGRTVSRGARVRLDAYVPHDRLKDLQDAIEAAEAPDHELIVAAAAGDKATRIWALLARCDHEDCWSCPAHTSQLGRDDCFDCARYRELGKACPDRRRR